MFGLPNDRGIVVVFVGGGWVGKIRVHASV